MSWFAIVLAVLGAITKTAAESVVVLAALKILFGKDGDAHD